VIVLTILLSLLGIYLSAYVVYQSVLFIGNALIPDAPEFTPEKFRRFNVVIPAHNEELYLPRLLESLRAQDYPKEGYQATVVADNCTDGTAAASHPFDVDLLERADSSRKGKGHAIRWALERIDTARFDAIVIVDADSIVEPEFLKQLNLQMERGDRVIQCYNGVANPGQSWFTRLMDVSRTIGNDILHPGKRKLGLSSYLMGNGMCFDVRLLKAHGWDAFSVGEDWEYYARLVLAGEYIGYSKFSRVFHQESLNLKQASSQRIRWSSGRFQVLREYGFSLFMKGLRNRNLRCLDASLPLVFPNPSLGMNLTFVGTALTLAYWLLGGGVVLFAWYLSLVLIQVALFIVGVFHTKDRMASALSLVLAPVFLGWKMGIDILSFCGVGRKDWKRTDRKLS
jgi:cellulose synthase/poly-beta-1,6-N-acetylglucosamine synthase-like glycosyltransferase